MEDMNFELNPEELEQGVGGLAKDRRNREKEIQIERVVIFARQLKHSGLTEEEWLKTKYAVSVGTEMAKKIWNSLH